MTTQYTPILKLALPVTGELSGTWGDIVNDNITSMIEQAIAGLATIATWTTNSHTLTTANGTTSESRCAMLVAANGAGLSAAGEIICPATSKLYVLKNNTSYAITLKTSGGTGVSVPSGQTAFLFCDGTNVNACVTTIVDGHISGNLTVSGNATIDGNTTLGNALGDIVTINGTATFVNAAPTLSTLTASQPVFTNGSKQLVSNAITGTGNVVMSASPTLTGTVGAASLTLSSLTSGRVTYAGASGLLQDSANLTFNGTDLTVSGALNAGSVNATTLDLTNLEVTNIKAKDGTASASIADATGAFSVASAFAANGDSTLGDAVGDAITVNGTTTFVNAAPTLSTLTASQAVFTNGSKQLVSNAITGTGNVVMSTSPTLTTPTLGAATATSINKLTITAPATSATLTIANSKTLTANNSLTLAGTDATTMTFPSTSASIARTDAGQTFTGTQTVLAAATQDAVAIAGRAGGTSSYVATLTTATLAASVTHTLPAITGTLATLANTSQTFTGAVTVSGAFTANGNITLGDANTDTITVGDANASMANGSKWKTTTTAGNNFHLAAYDTDTGPGYVNLITLTAGTAPTLNLNSVGNLTMQIGGVTAATLNTSSQLLIGTATNTNSSTVVSGGSISETVSGSQYLVASQYDIGTKPNQIPLNQYLGALAYQDSMSAALTPGGGITLGTGTVCKGTVVNTDGVKRATIVLDLTGLADGNAAGDIIGSTSTSIDSTKQPAFIAQLPVAFTALGGRMTCLETPAGGNTDIDLYSATEGTGVQDSSITALTETQVVNGGAQTTGTVSYFIADPAAQAYLYLVSQGTGAATYTAGRFLIEIFGV